jgi:hypothetical protein
VHQPAKKAAGDEDRKTDKTPFTGSTLACRIGLTCIESKRTEDM